VHARLNFFVRWEKVQKGSERFEACSTGSNQLEPCSTGSNQLKPCSTGSNHQPVEQGLSQFERVLVKTEWWPPASKAAKPAVAGTASTAVASINKN
jgi:hypothetical protein